jgi:cytochrome c1
MLPLDRETLDAWVRNPQSAKPGCLMPAFGLDEKRRRSIVEYLLTLR